MSQVLLELARSRNKIPLPKSIAPPGSIPLPPEQDTLLSENYQLLPALKPPAQTEEAEDDNEGADAIPANPSPNYSQDQRGSEQHQSHSQSQSQSQRRRRARVNLSRSWIPRPPWDSGVMTALHATLHLPPVASLSCAQRKRRMALSTSLENFFGALSTVRANVGIAERTQRTSTLRPAICISLPFQPARRARILSRMNCRWTRRILLVVIGRPRYVMHSDARMPPKFCKMEPRSRSPQLIGTAEDLARLTCRPVASPKR